MSSEEESCLMEESAKLMDGNSPHNLLIDEFEIDSSLIQGPLPAGLEDYHTDLGDDLRGSCDDLINGVSEVSEPQDLNDTIEVSNGDDTHFQCSMKSTSTLLSQNDFSLRFSSASLDNSVLENQKGTSFGFSVDHNGGLNIEDISEDLDDTEKSESYEDDEVYSSNEDSGTTTDDEALNVSSEEPSSENEENEDETQSGDIRKRKCQVKEKLTRKRLKHPEKWKKTVNKVAVSQGLEYKSLNTGKIVHARTMRRGCGPGCKFKCEEKVSEERRNSIFQVYYTIPNQSQKYGFIQRHVKRKRKQTNQDQITRKAYTCEYSLTNENNESIKVCQTMFLATLDISVSAVKTALNKITNQDPVLIDMRGRAPKMTQRTDENKILSVRKHISLFPRVESHYIRGNSSREYLEENLSITKMYRLYLAWAKEEKEAVASQQCYVKIFNEEYNISFFKPKKDACDTCEGYRNACDRDKIELEEDYQEHIQNKNYARALKKSDADLARKNVESTTCVACFDFQKILSTPRSNASSLYYKRKLSVYNFTIYDIGNHEGWCYVWSEYDAKKGAIEVATCLFKFFQVYQARGVKKFSLYCDNCYGQNKNRMLFAMFVYASVILEIDIVLTYLEAGHTQNEGDSVHAQIERYSSGRKIFSQAEWCDVIRSAKEKDPKYKVCEMKFDDFLDFKKLAEKLNWNITVVEDNKRSSKAVGVLEFKQVSVSKKFPNKIMYKKSLQKEFQCLVTRKKQEHANVKKFKLEKAYSDVQGLPKGTRDDLLDLCKKNTIKPPYHQYYYSFKLRKDDAAELKKSKK